MDSMYDTMMSLPLMKGVSKTQLSDFVAKTPLHFTSFGSGETVEEYDAPCSTVKCLVSGSVRMILRVLGGKADVGSTLKAPAVLGLQNLFGLHTHSMFWAISLGQCGIMEFDKARFLELLRGNNICLLNVLNDLSWRCQRAQSFMHDAPRLDAPHRLALLVLSSTEIQASEIHFSANGTPVADVLCDTAADREALADMEAAGIIRFRSESVIEIPSRDRLRDFV